ncbi:MAG: DUF1080 domain-containing protein [Planctomycetes bacterium]|nr:DUF1080 domain-containing protein [Planctomycetota bacterium]
MFAGLAAGALAAAVVGSWAIGAGYDNTPFLPGQKWRVHDSRRVPPRRIIPSTPSTQERPGRPPSDAVVLFDGKDLSHWQTIRKGKTVPAGWKVENGYMEIVPKSGSLVSKEKFGDCQIHVEWASPRPSTGHDQACGNSGVLIMGRYEIQVLDSYENVTYADGQAAAMYGQYPPLVNASLKPGQWQTYDIIFEAPRFKDGKLIKPAYVTVLHNGIVVHNHQAFLGPTVHKKVAHYRPHAPEGPLMLQDHGHRVRYRNIWVRRLVGYDQSPPRPSAAGK